MESSLFGYSVEDFQEEAKELLLRAEAVLADLKASPGNPEQINALFRAIHSLKGSAAYAGLKEVNSFAHLYESFLGEIRNKKQTVDESVVKILFRAKDYLEDLIFSPDKTKSFNIEEMDGSSLEILTQILERRASDRTTGGPPHTPSVASKPEKERRTETEPSSPSSESEESSSLSITSNDPVEMSPSDVVKVSIVKGLKAYSAALRKSPLDNTQTLKALKKLEDTVQWAFGDELEEVLKLLTEAKEILSGEADAEKTLQLQRSFNIIAQTLKGELTGMESQAQEDEPQQQAQEETAAEEEKSDTLEEERPSDAKKLMASDIRGVSEDDIVRITLTKTLDNFASLLADEHPNEKELKRFIERLDNLNKWAFNDQEDISTALTHLKDLQLRPVDDKIIAQIREKGDTVRSMFSSFLGLISSEKPAVAEAEEMGEVPSSSPPSEMKQAPKIKPALTSGPTIRVRSEDIEALMDTVGDISGLEPSELEKLQAQALQLRMIPVGEIFSRFRKIVRDLGEELNKDIYLEISGESVTLDKMIVDKIQEPLLHMVRNAASHGLESREELRESGKSRSLITLSAYQEGGQVIIEISDNGRGISLDNVQSQAVERGLIEAGAEIEEKALLDLIFTPGFSTQEEADSISGRGVGMDVVKEMITSLQGSVNIKTVEGEGTTFKLVLPLTLAIIKALLLQECDNKIALPAATIDRVIPMSDRDIRENSFMDKNRLSLDLKDEGEVIPLVDLAGLFGRQSKGASKCVVLVREGDESKVALVVDSALERRPLTVKPLDRFAENKYFSSAAVVDNDLILILNVPSLMAA